MLTLEEAVTIEVLRKQGRGLRETARELGVSRNTVRKYLRDRKLPQYSPRPSRPSKLDAFEVYLRARLAIDPTLQASVLCREIRERGYDGAESMVRARVASLKPKAPAEPVVRFETATGRQLQVDYAEFYHDKDGLSVGEQVRENTRRLTASCPRKNGVTRTVIPGSLRVYPIEGYGAVQVGAHRFDERGAAKSTRARFVSVWRRQDRTVAARSRSQPGPPEHPGLGS